MSACSSWCGWCGRCTDGDGRDPAPEPRTPEEAERDFLAAVKQAEIDSIAMRLRWAAQDAAKKQGAA